MSPLDKAPILNGGDGEGWPKVAAERIAGSRRS